MKKISKSIKWEKDSSFLQKSQLINVKNGMREKQNCSSESEITIAGMKHLWMLHFYGIKFS